MAQTYETSSVKCTTNQGTITCNHKGNIYYSAQAQCTVDDENFVSCQPAARTSTDEISKCSISADGSSNCVPNTDGDNSTISDDGIVKCVVSADGARYKVTCTPTGTPFPNLAPPIVNVLGMSAAAVRTFSALITTLMAGLCALQGGRFAHASINNNEFDLLNKILLVCVILVFLQTGTLTGVYWTQADEDQEKLAYSFIPALVLAVIIFILLLLSKIENTLAVSNKVLIYTMGGISVAVAMLITFFFVAVFAN